GEVKIYSESYVESQALDYLRDKYDYNLPVDRKRFKTEKSSAITMLRTFQDREDYQYVKSLVFNVDGLSNFISESLSKCKELGMDVVPHIMIEPEEVPNNLEDFKVWLKDKLAVMWELRGDIPSDGVVVDVD